MRRTFIWLRELRLLWWGLLAFIACSTAIAFSRPLGYEAFERTIRISGLLLQLVAVGTALSGLNSARRLFDLPPIFEVLRTWWQSAPWKSGVSGHLSGNVTMGPFTVSGSMHSWAESHALLPEAARIEALEQRTTVLLELTNTFRKQHRADLQELRDGFAQSLAEHSTNATKTAATLQKFALDGAATTAVGLSCAFIGIIIASASPEIAKCLG
jgi:hypothetical protein